MHTRVVLVTGASRRLGSRLAGVLAAEPAVERVLAVDTVPPSPAARRRLGAAQFVRADIRAASLSRLVAGGAPGAGADAVVDTVVHAGVLASAREAGGRAAMKETNVIGTMQLLAACQRAPHLRRLVLRSTTAVYGSSPRDPALFTEDQEPQTLPRSGYPKDAVEVEGYARGFARRRPDVTLTVLRVADVLGPSADDPLARWLSLPVVPTVAGYDPRLQLCAEDDAVEALRRTAVEDHPGTFNVAGPGVLLLSQALRRSGRAGVALPASAVAAVARALRRAGLVDIAPEQVVFLRHGRGVDVGRLERELGWLPRPTAQALEEFTPDGSAARVPGGALPGSALTAAERHVLELLERRHPPHRDAAGA